MACAKGSEEDREAFWARTERSSSGCWLWTGKMSGPGYGSYRGAYAHRLAYEFSRGAVGRGLVVRHRCDVRACVNPDHLELGSQRENILDAVLRSGRKCDILTPADVLACRKRYAAGERICDLRREYGVNKNTMWHAIKGRNWRHLSNAS